MSAPVWSEEHGGHWVASSHQACRVVAADAATFSSAHGVHVPPTGLYERGIRIFALEHDEPVHWEHREILRAAVGDRPSSVEEQLIRDCLEPLLAALDWSQDVDLVAELTDPLPLDVIFAIIGGDAEFKPEMKALTDALLGRAVLPDGTDPAARVHDIARTMVQRRLDAPQDDWISRLPKTEVLGQSLEVEDMVAAVVSLITGGHHSTSRGLGSLLARVLTEPGLQDELRSDPSLIPAAIEETLRLHTPLPEFSRTAVVGTEVAGCPVAAGQQVQLRYDLANRDPAVFAEPAAFRLDRRRSQHLAFGHGAHRCIGLHLARAELRIALEELLARRPHLALARPVDWRGPAEPAALWIR